MYEFLALVGVAALWILIERIGKERSRTKYSQLSHFAKKLIDYFRNSSETGQHKIIISASQIQFAHQKERK